VRGSRSNSIMMKMEAGVKGVFGRALYIYSDLNFFLDLRHSERVLVGMGHVGVFFSLCISSLSLSC
jgi:hypothetical protein